MAKAPAPPRFEPEVCAICGRAIKRDDLTEYRRVAGKRDSALVHVLCSAAQRRDERPR